MKVTKRITMSVLTLVLTVIALGTITFAWFSLSTVSNVSNISGTVRGGEGLEIRLVGGASDIEKTSWRSNLSDTEVGNFIDSLKANFEFNAVSTTNGTSFTMMAENLDKQMVVNGADAVANEHYLEFKIQFKSATAGTIVLNGYELSGGTGTTFTPDANYNQIGGDDPVTPTNIDVEIDPSNGARFSLDGTIGTAAVKAYQKEEIPYTITGDVIKGNLANDETVVQGQYSYLTVSKAMKLYYNDRSNDLEIGTETGAAKLLSSIQMFAADQDLTNATQIALVTNAYDDGEGDPQVHISDAGENSEYVAELTIRIWLEGWDADTYDALYTGKLVLNLTFIKQ